VALSKSENRCAPFSSFFLRHRRRVMYSRPLRLIHKSDLTFIHVCPTRAPLFLSLPPFPPPPSFPPLSLSLPLPPPLSLSLSLSRSNDRFGVFGDRPLRAKSSLPARARRGFLPRRDRELERDDCHVHRSPRYIKLNRVDRRTWAHARFRWYRNTASVSLRDVPTWYAWITHTFSGMRCIPADRTLCGTLSDCATCTRQRVTLSDFSERASSETRRFRRCRSLPSRGDPPSARICIIRKERAVAVRYTA